MTSQRVCESGGGLGDARGARAGAALGLTLVALLAAGCPVRVHTTYGDAASGDTGSGSGGKTGSGGQAASGGTGGSAGTEGGQGGTTTGSGGSASGGAAPVDGGADRPPDGGMGGTGGMSVCPACTAPTPFCNMDMRKCVGCLSNTNCSAPTPLCDTTGSQACVGCLSNGNCSETTPVCDMTAHKCVGCLQNSQCVATSTKPICDANTKACAGCTTPQQCMTVNLTTPVCLSGGSCVQCNVKMDCAGATGTPVCFENKCVGCLADSDCTDANKPICNTANHTCGACSANDQCRMKSPNTPGCITTPGAGQGTCVACTEHAHCTTATKPVCVANACTGCTSDAQCVAKGGADPGVCMLHTDRHCATAEEVLYVKPAPGCDDNGTGIMAAVPFCTVQRALTSATATRNVVVIRKGTVDLVNWTFAGATPISVIGQGGAAVGPGAGIGIEVTSGSVYIRNLGVSRMTGVGISVAPSATLKMDGCVVTMNNGGLAVNGGGFEINNSVFAENTAATTPVAFGGVYLKAGAGTPKQFRNNTIYANAGPGLVCDGMYPVRGLLVANNMVSQVTACDFADTSSVVVVGTTGNAYFDTAPGRAYHLTSMSPCVDVGMTTDFATHDIDGNPRPSPTNGRPDCGAHELQK